MQAALTHDRIQRQLRKKLRRYVKFAWDSNLNGIQWMYDDRHDVLNAVSTECEHTGSLPSGKDYCRTDVELKLPDETLAFEIKTSTNDAKKWFTQRQDYRATGLSPAIVLTKETAYKMTPHVGDTLESSYIAIDRRDHTYHWNHESTPPGIDTQFDVSDPISPHDYCPECGCWTNSTGHSVNCVNCDWRHFFENMR